MESIHSYVYANVSGSSQGVSQEVMFQTCGLFDKLTFEREYQNNVVVTNGYNNYNGVFNVP